ncbi:uncharacterized protein FIBRA_04536 [Fibroporia radiculosa]|uniref:Uncharacterized protein n=1 Tax=Fibroporia radiculosa TaxID=599839 RepID=J4HWK8_9APHY|nr:uncharacterized protein FIBRA_04536 [Fibroporia radiculosa]CCM02437.1 predicted protein [Fibroporia radiculosa]
MSDAPGLSKSKAIASMAKREDDVTRVNARGKLRFVPTLPARRLKEDVKKVRILLALSRSCLTGCEGRARRRS